MTLGYKHEWYTWLYQRRRWLKLLTTDKVYELSERAWQISDDHKARFNDFKLDVSKKERLNKCTCKTCWYLLRPKQGGRVPTRSNCQICSTEMRFVSTITDMLCTNCAREYMLCRECGSLLHYVRDNRNERPKK